jgi:DNA (cytosine-5)-methyltransferase 1
MTVVWANEINAHACKTYRYNFPKTHLYEHDITKIVLRPSDDGELDLESIPNVDIITSGFPCQAFSIAGYRQGFQDNRGRGNLFFDTVRFIEQIKPKAFLLENVRNLVGHDGGKTFQIIRNTLTDPKGLNYSFIPFILNAIEYGNIPQTRVRIYIVGFKNEGSLIAPLNVSPEDDLIIRSICGFHESVSSKFRIPDPIPLTIKIKDLLAKSEEELDGTFYYKKGHPYYEEMSRNIISSETLYQWRRHYVRENKNNVCPTLTANMGTGGHNVPIILDPRTQKIRRLTPKECANFQGFSPGFTFPPDVAMSHRFKQAGNSVVVPVVERIAKNIKEAILAS